ncbi:hypothetical protein [Granulosicoccus antarcticus]|uniref:Uncharacterized protein n=1 Tax=Granulosicoccus antarcticus IMCC3135 TaxID=1192854 RepID=A0A2Z2NP75_9GAMM|nr:hypothetical protein [Granulosicoccus antarcticus]ASJ73282.1 hypothetical protein IMCC3135_16000 [Granulosicoccus antarcticus IMCC3135]
MNKVCLIPGLIGSYTQSENLHRFSVAGWKELWGDSQNLFEEVFTGGGIGRLMEV